VLSGHNIQNILQQLQDKLNKISETSAKISEILEVLNVKPNAFAVKLGYPRSQTIYDILNGKSLPSFDFFYRILSSEYSEIINIEYIISGKGKALKQKAEKTTDKDNFLELNMIRDLSAENALLKKELEEVKGKKNQPTRKLYGNNVAEP